MLHTMLTSVQALQGTHEALQELKQHKQQTEAATKWIAYNDR